MLRAQALALTLAVAGPAAAGAAMPAPIVFFDIAGPDAAAQSAFYRDVFDWRTGPGGVLSAPVSGPSLAGALRQDPADKVIYLGVEDVAATLDKVLAHGGKIVRKRFEVKGVVVLGLFTDPAGNAMGLVEMRDGKPVTP
jgi:predicted enzyme related to lactoylglutathione lyase